jgi:hypothetical protein
MAKNIDLIKIFGVEGLITPRTLVNEKKHDVDKKNPMEASSDIKALLDEMNMRAVSGDLTGVEECLAAIQLRVDLMKSIAKGLRDGSIR